VIFQQDTQLQHKHLIYMITLNLIIHIIRVLSIKSVFNPKIK